MITFNEALESAKQQLALVMVENREKYGVSPFASITPEQIEQFVIELQDMAVALIDDAVNEPIRQRARQAVANDYILENDIETGMTSVKKTGYKPFDTGLPPFGGRTAAYKNSRVYAETYRNTLLDLHREALERSAEETKERNSEIPF